MAIIPFARLPHSVMCALCAPATLISLAVIRIDKELSISNSTNIGEVSGAERTGGVVGQLDNYVNSAGTKLYSHNTSFSIIGCGNKGSVSGTKYDAAGIVAWLGNAISYAGIISQNTANTVVNKIAVNYCFNAGNIGGTDGKSGIVGWSNNHVGYSTDRTRGGRSKIDISYNWNAGNVLDAGNDRASGIIRGIANYIYGDNCYCDVNVNNNFNSGEVKVVGLTQSVGSIISCFDVVTTSNNPANINILITNNYNYSTSIAGGYDAYRGGVIGYFRNGNLSRVNLLNNYSAYKREDDNNVHGQNTTNPTTLGANVGEVF